MIPNGGAPDSDSDSPVELSLELRGLRVAALRWGPAGPPQVMLLHGFLDQALSWDAVGRSLAAGGFTAVAPDHRGHGRSTWAPPGSSYAFAEYLADLDALFDAVAPAPLVLVGHSMGGTLAGQYAGLRPGRVRGLLLVDGLGPPAVDADGAAEQLRVFLDDQAKLRRGEGPRAAVFADRSAAVDRLMRGWPDLSLAQAQALSDRALVPAPGGLRWGWDPAHRTRSAVAFHLDRHLALLRQVAAPTALVYGAEGFYPHLPDLAEREAALRRVVRRDLLPCGHNVHQARPDALAAAIVELLQPDGAGAGASSR